MQVSSIVRPLPGMYSYPSLYADNSVQFKTLFLFIFLTTLSHYMRQILEALRYCHDNNVIHRDVKVKLFSCMNWLSVLQLFYVCLLLAVVGYKMYAIYVCNNPISFP